MEQFKLSEKKEFFNALSYLYNAGFSYTEVFKSIEASTRSKNIKELCFKVRTDIEKGIPFRDIITSYKSITGETYAMLLCAGDMSGKAADSLSAILKDITRMENLKDMLISSLTYPAFLFLAAIGVFFFCQFFFFKIFATMYTGDACCSVGTLLFSAIVKIILIYVLLFVLLFLFIKNKQANQKFMDFVVEHTPLSCIVNNYYYTNFFSVMAGCYDAGITIVDSVGLAASVLKTKHAFLSHYKIISVLQSGAPVLTAFNSVGLFSEFAISQIAVGEKTGKLGEAFQRISLDYERKMHEIITCFSKLINPVAIVLMGILVGYVAVNFYKGLYGGILGAF